MLITHESALPSPLAPPLHTRMMNTVYSLHTMLAERQRKASEQWDDMPRWRKFASAALSATGVVILARVTGAGSGLDQLPHIEATGPAAPDLVSVSSTSLDIHDTNLHLLAAPSPPLETHTGDDAALPANIDTAPQPEPIGTYNRVTGEGTVWHSVDVYADKLGYDNLTGSQQWQATDHVLKLNGLTWQEARSLSPTYEPLMPTQRAMEDLLETNGATRTHAADRATAVPIPRGDNTPDLPGGTQQAPQIEVQVAPPCAETLIPWHDCEFNGRDLGFGALVGFMLAGGYIAQQGINRRRAAAIPPPVIQPIPVPAAPATPTGPATSSTAQGVTAPAPPPPANREWLRPPPDPAADNSSTAGRAAKFAMLTAAAAMVTRRWRMIRRRRRPANK